MPLTTGKWVVTGVLSTLLVLWWVVLPVASADSGRLDILSQVPESGCGSDAPRPRIALALSGGGARGLAQIGVLRALEENNIEIDLITGVSMGAIVGGLYACEISPDSLEALVRNIDWATLFRNEPSRTQLLLSQKDKSAGWFVEIPMHGIRPDWPTSVTSGQRLYNYISGLTQRATYLSDGQFDRLCIRFRAVSTDLVTGTPVVFSDGEVALAVRASMAFPLAVSPLQWEGRLLADGGLIDPLPVELADSLSECPVVAVNTASALSSLEKLDDPYALANQATSVMTAQSLERSLARADFVCVPVSSDFGNVEFDQLDTLLALGYQAGRRLATEILSRHGQIASTGSTQTEEPVKVRVDSVVFSGHAVFADSTLRAALALEMGREYSLPALQAAILHVEELYFQRHLTLADVTQANVEDGILHLIIDEGNLAGIELTGTRTVKSWVILRSFPLKRGIPFSARKVADGLADLHGTGLFEQVSSEVVHTPEGPLLRLHVTERRTDALRIGLHHNLEYQTEGFIQWANTNLFGLGNELTLHAQYAPRREHYFVRAKSDRIFRTYLTASLRAFHHLHEKHLYRNHEQTSAFTTTRDGFDFTVGQNISRFAQMAFVVGAERIDFDIDSTDVEYDQSTFALVGRLDDLDDAVFPTIGRRLTAQLTWGDDFFGGDLIYRAFRADGEWILSPLKHLSLAIGGRAGSADRVLPLHEQFSLGGLRSFMGLAEDELLGDRLVAATAWGRYRFYSLSYLTGRLDVGNVWSKGTDINFWESLRFGAGAGLMFDTPIGPLVILQGFADRGDHQFYFSWGYDF